jgi:hypothetical protein
MPLQKHKLEICHYNSLIPLSMPFSLLRSITVPKILVFQCVFQYSPYYPVPKFVQHIYAEISVNTSLYERGQEAKISPEIMQQQSSG